MFKDAAKIIARFVVAANQTGKSTIGAREVSWVFEKCHPYWDLEAEFGDKPLLILVMGRVAEQVETELWNRKIKPFLSPGTFKEVRKGNALQRVTHNTNGNTIVFLSHHNVNEAREKAQSYTAVLVWLDEMPNSLSLIVELILRVQANGGRFLATFTPLIRNKEIKDYVEKSAEPNAKKYVFEMLDNPIYKGREEEVLAQYENMPEDERNARLFGKWFKGGRSVYTYSAEKQQRNPPGYAPNWPHVEIVDPAASGKAGLLLLASRPGERSWYAVHAEYLEGDAPSTLLDILEEKTKGFNIVRRVSDPHEAWFIKEAAKRKRFYSGVFKKNDRKKELITNLQDALLEDTFVITHWAQLLVDEVDSCMWSETKEDKIIGASRFHLLDCAQYGLDNLPKLSKDQEPKTQQQEIREAHRERKKKEYQKKVQKAMPGRGRIVARRGKKWRA